MKLNLLALAACVGVSGCRHEPPPSPKAPQTTPAAAESPLAALAKAIDARETSPLEPQMPLELRLLLPPDDEPLSSEDLLRRARDHAAKFTENTSVDDHATSAREALLAIALAERASTREPPASVQASAFLVDLLRSFGLRQYLGTMMGSSAASFDHADAQKLAQKLAVLRGYELLAPQAFSHVQKHAARVLRAGTPKSAVLSVLWRFIQDWSESKPGFDAFIAEYRRLKPTLDAAELTRIAELHAQLGERSVFEQDAADAKSAVEQLKATRRPLLARLADATEKRRAAERLATLRGDEIGTRLERFDLLERLERSAADAELDALDRLAAGDGRVRARLAHRAFRRGSGTKGVIAAAADGRALLKAVPITSPSLDDARVDVGFAGLEVAVAMAKLSDPKVVELYAGMAPLDAAVQRYAKFDPDSAAGLTHAARRLRELLSLSDAERKKKLPGMLRHGATEIAALRQRLPANVDVMRIALVYAARHPEPARGLELALDDRGYGYPSLDVDVVLDRVATALTLVAVTGIMKPLPSLRAALDAVPPGLDEDHEGARLALLADVAMLDALSGKGSEWVDVARRYEEAELMLSTQRARLRNNRAYALKRAGYDPVTLWDAAAGGGAPGELRVVAWLNGGLARGGSFADLGPHAERAATKAIEMRQTEVASVLYRWLAENAPDRAAAKRWATEGIKIEDSRRHPDFAAGLPLFCQGDQRFAVGATTKVMGYVFTAQATCRFWLTDARLATGARLEKLAREPGWK